MTNEALPSGLSVLVPVYNSADIIPILCQRLAITLPEIVENYEVILINDGSHDQSWENIVIQVGLYSWLRGINLHRNFGQHNALLCGIRAARYATVVTIDDDLQHPPEHIQALIQELIAGNDVVYGTPMMEQHGLWRNLASKITKIALQSSMGATTARHVSAFRTFRTDLRSAFESYQSPYVSIDVLLTWATNRFSAVPVPHTSRYRGESQYTFRKLVIHAINMITGFSVLPLRLASLMGFGFALFGALVLIYVIGRYLILGGSVPGFPFLASTIAIFSGVQLFALGIIGEYLARMHFRLMDRPPYVVRTEIMHEPG